MTWFQIFKKPARLDKLKKKSLHLKFQYIRERKKKNLTAGGSCVCERKRERERELKQMKEKRIQDFNYILISGSSL